MRRWLLPLALLGWLAAAAGAAQAQQLDFRRVTWTGEEQLSYRWRDHSRREFQTVFTLTRDVVRQAESSFLEFSLEAMWRVIEDALADEVDKFGNGAKLELTRHRDGLSWSVFTRDRASGDALAARLAERRAKTESGYLAKHLRHRVDEWRIMVDFAAAAETLREPMRATTLALGHSPGIADTDRARVAHALAFFQDIPYAVFEDKNRQGGDFLSAPALLAQNRGDCDSKAVALAAVLRTYAPWRKLAVVTMPGHAILAVDLPAETGERTIRAHARQYVALEAAGPALAPIGRVGRQTERFLAAGREIEVWPLN